MNLRSNRFWMALTACAAAGAVGVLAQSGTARPPAPSREWPTYGHDAGGRRFSPLTQITPANVSQLEVAWVYHMRPASAAPVARAAGPAPQAGGPAGNATGAPRAGGPGRGRAGGPGFSVSTVTPLVVGGVMYLSTPYSRVVALEAATGKETWAYPLPTGNPSTRGVEYWPGDGTTPPQIVAGSNDGKLYSLDAKTGQPNPAFGEQGVVDLNTPEILRGLPGRDGLSAHRL